MKNLHNDNKSLNSRFRRAIYAVIAVCILASLPLHAAEKDYAPATVAIFSARGVGLQFNALIDKSAEAVSDTFDRLGRFMPVEAERVKAAIDALPEGSDEDALFKAARGLNAELYAIVSITSMGDVIYGTITITPVSERYRYLRESITVRSTVMLNVPLKLAREIALFHKKIPLEARVLEKRDGLYVLNAGQWHGVSPGRYSAEGGSFLIRQTGRLQSLAELSEKLAKSPRIIIRTYPYINDVLRNIDVRIDYNTRVKYGLAGASPGDIGAERRFAQGMCIINLGANACIPGYGSFLSTSYMGFKNPTPSVPGVVFSSLLILTHFLLPETMAKFKINFFPGVMDRDKTTSLNNLQIFLWSTLPLTASVAFMDQLAHQFETNKVLPPFFTSRNESALVFSILIPGGGLFYKGYRFPGWCFHVSEMFLAGFCIYTKDEKKKVMYGGIALGGVKLIELLTAYFCRPAYEFFNIEKEGRAGTASLSMDMSPAEAGDLVYKIGAAYHY